MGPFAKAGSSEWSLRLRRPWVSQVGMMGFEGSFAEDEMMVKTKYSASGVFVELYPVKAPIGLRLEGVEAIRATGNSELGVRTEYSEARAWIISDLEAKPYIKVILGLGGGMTFPLSELFVSDRSTAVKGQRQFLAGSLIGLRCLFIGQKLAFDIQSTSIYSEAYPDRMLTSVGGAISYRF